MLILLKGKGNYFKKGYNGNNGILSLKSGPQFRSFGTVIVKSRALDKRVYSMIIEG